MTHTSNKRPPSRVLRTRSMATGHHPSPILAYQPRWETQSQTINRIPNHPIPSQPQHPAGSDRSSPITSYTVHDTWHSKIQQTIRISHRDGFHSSKAILPQCHGQPRFGSSAQKVRGGPPDKKALSLRHNTQNRMPEGGQLYLKEQK
ncbi:hypothetical protein LXL04_015561 [Taraxacum kok-saghyz]